MKISPCGRNDKQPLDQSFLREGPNNTACRKGRKENLVITKPENSLRPLRPCGEESYKSEHP
jgi:hypothetical protein